MKIGGRKFILDPYEWLPGYGESRVKFFSNGLDVTLSIEYDKVESEGDSYEEVKRELHFLGASLFIRQSSYCGGIFQYIDEANDLSKNNLGSLCEFIKSDFLLLFQASDKSGYSKSYRHFNIHFLSENQIFHILAKDFTLSDEIFID